MTLLVTWKDFQEFSNVTAGCPDLGQVPCPVDQTEYLPAGTILSVKLMAKGSREFSGATPTMIRHLILPRVWTVTCLITTLFSGTLFRKPLEIWKTMPSPR